MTPHEVLGLDAAAARDPAVVRAAYARLLRLHRPDRDPAGFRRLRDAYETALCAAADGDDGQAASASGAIAAVATVLAPPASPAPAAPAPASPPSPSPSPIADLSASPRAQAQARLAAEDGDVAADLRSAAAVALLDPALAARLADRAFRLARAVVPGIEARIALGARLAAIAGEDHAAVVAALETDGAGGPLDAAQRGALRRVAYRASGDLAAQLLAAAARHTPETPARELFDRHHRQARRQAWLARGTITILLVLAGVGLVWLMSAIRGYERTRPRPRSLPTAELLALTERARQRFLHEGLARVAAGEAGARLRQLDPACARDDDFALTAVGLARSRLPIGVRGALLREAATRRGPLALPLLLDLARRPPPDLDRHLAEALRIGAAPLAGSDARVVQALVELVGRGEGAVPTVGPEPVWRNQPLRWSVRSDD